MQGSWATKRRFIQGGVFLIVVALLFGLIFWKIFYKTPTCSDGYKNGDETGVDCGGSCINLCTSDTLNPVVLWSKIFNISGDVYTAVAYIENPNLNSNNKNASYQFSIFDDKGNLIITKDGTTSIPKGKKFAVFETGIVLKGSKPKTSDFKFIKFGPWEKDLSKEPEITVKYGALSASSSIPRITGTISNESLQNISGLELAVFVLDGNENVVAASNTFVDNLLKRTTQDFVFTWPKQFDLGVESCLSPVDLALVLDKSGSMRSEGDNPPEPFTTVLYTAQSFIKNLKSDDQVSVVSFGNNSKIESFLSTNKTQAINAVESMSLSTSSEQTNIYEGLLASIQELTSVNAKKDNKKVIVLLTDGVPTEPKEANVENYPVTSAQKLVENIGSTKGIEIFTIGLGKSVSEDFLKSISFDNNHYFYAPSKETLNDVYSKISKNLCPRKPNVINVIYRTIK